MTRKVLSSDRIAEYSGDQDPARQTVVLNRSARKAGPLFAKLEFLLRPVSWGAPREFDLSASGALSVPCRIKPVRGLENSMHTKTIGSIALTFLALTFFTQAMLPVAVGQEVAKAQQDPYH